MSTSSTITCCASTMNNDTSRQPKSQESSQQKRKKKKLQRYRRKQQHKNQRHKPSTTTSSGHPAICTTHRWIWKTSNTKKNFLRGKNGNFSKDTQFVLQLNKTKLLSSTFNPQLLQFSQKTPKAISLLPLSHPPPLHHWNPIIQSNLLRI